MKTKSEKYRHLLLLITVFVIASVANSSSQVKIAVSKSSSHYESWLKSADINVIPVNMYSLRIDSAVRLLTTCNALLLTGGEDVDPANYGKLLELYKCETINPYRDSLEFALIKKALSLKMPVFGICRGEQILNVALGGTLFTDIPTDVDSTVLHRCSPSATSCLHRVTLVSNSKIGRITRQKTGMVNSYHHQAVDKPAPGIKITAYSDNGVVEAIESNKTIVKSFLMGVQWHPERLSQNPSLALPLARKFVKEAKKFSKTGKKS